LAPGLAPVAPRAIFTGSHVDAMRITLVIPAALLLLRAAGCALLLRPRSGAAPVDPPPSRAGATRSAGRRRGSIRAARRRVGWMTSSVTRTATTSATGMLSSGKTLTKVMPKSCLRTPAAPGRAHARGVILGAHPAVAITWL
jgi:hypothetical protein